MAHGHQRTRNISKTKTPTNIRQGGGWDHSPWLLPVLLTVPGGPDRFDSLWDPAEPVLAPGGGPRSRHLSPSRPHPSLRRPLCGDHSGLLPGPASVAANALLPMYNIHTCLYYVNWNFWWVKYLSAPRLVIMVHIAHINNVTY